MKFLLVPNLNIEIAEGIYHKISWLLNYSFDMKFTYVNAGSEGSAVNAIVLATAVQEGFSVPKGIFKKNKFKV